MNVEKIFYIILSTVLVTIFILFTFIFSPNGIDSRNTSKVKTIYFADHISRAHQKVIDIFNERNKGSIKVETINLSFEKFSTNERKELLARYLRSKNNRIDVYAVDQIWVPRFAKWSVPLQKFIDSSEIKNILPNALETCIYQDTLVAVPMYVDISLMFYRDDIIKTLKINDKTLSQLHNSITWRDFIELRKNSTQLKNPFYVFQADDYEGLLCAFTELMANQNNPIVDKSGKLLIDTPEGRRSLKLLVDLVNTYDVSPKEVTSLKENDSFRFYAKHDGVFFRLWSSMIDDDNEYLTDEKRKLLKMIPVPHFEDTKPSYVYGGWNLMISQFSEKIPEAVKFVKFLLSEEAQKIMYEEGRYAPINKRVYSDDKYLSKYPELDFFEDLFKNGVHRPFMESYTNVSDILSYYLNKAIKKEIPVEQALKEATVKINEKAILVK